MKSYIDREWIVSLTNVLITSRDWYRRESWRIINLTQPLPSPLGLHPAVYDALLQYSPISWHAVVLELPHIATDGVRVAYTRNDEHGEQNRQTVTTVGKYLKRHFPDLRDDVIRDLVALHSVPQSHFKLLDESTDQPQAFHCLHRHRLHKRPVGGLDRVCLLRGSVRKRDGLFRRIHQIRG